MFFKEDNTAFDQNNEALINEDDISLDVNDDATIDSRIDHASGRAWATAVEAVGLVRRENMKASEGYPDWLHHFELIAAELAVAENCPPRHIFHRAISVLRRYRN